MKFSEPFLIVCLVLLGSLPVDGHSVAIDYTGRIAGSGQMLNGKHYFRFALVHNDGKVVWNSDRSSAVSPSSPSEALPLQVSNGVYTVALGEAGAGMQSLDSSVVESPSKPRLRIWYADSNGWQQFFPDQELAFKASLKAEARNQPGLHSDPVLAELRYLRERVTKLERGAATPTRPPSGGGTVSIQLPPNLQGEHVLGSNSAPVVLLEYTDYQCPYCRRFYQTAFSLLKSNYVDTGKLRFISRNLPLRGHDGAVPAAIGTMCAGDQGNYWEMRRRLFESGDSLTTETIRKLGNSLEVDSHRFEECLTTNAYVAVLARQAQDATAVGITGTPTFVLGRLTRDGRLEGELLIGARPYQEFERKISAMMAETK